MKIYSVFEDVLYIFTFIDMNTYALCWKLKLRRHFIEQVQQSNLFFFFAGFVTMRRMEAMLYGVGNKRNIWRKHNDEKTLKRILDDGAK